MNRAVDLHHVIELWTLRELSEIHTHKPVCMSCSETKVTRKLWYLALNN